MSPRYHELVISQIVEETPDARSIVFHLSDDVAPLYRYRPGQFITVRVALQGKHLLRCYSMSSAPALDAGLKITVKRVVNGRVSNYLCDELHVGDKVSVMRPSGVFVPPSLNDDLLLCAGGSGITPMLSIIRSALSQGNGRIRLIYANRNEQSVIFKQQLQQLSAEYSHRFEVIHLLDSVQGVASLPLLARLAQPFIGQLDFGGCFICGPAPFMDAMTAALGKLGLDSHKIFVEKFVSLPDENLAAEVQPTNPQVNEARPSDAVAISDVVSHAIATIELDGESHQIPWLGEETLLQAAAKHGLELPHSCKAGMCASCMCEVVSGRVQLQHNEVLSERDLKQSLILSCQAVPLTDKVHVRYG